MHLRLERWASPISPLLLVTDTKGILRALEYADYEARMHRLLRRHYGSYTLKEGAAPLSLTQALDAYFAGCIDVLAGVEIATGGTPFQRRVWRALAGHSSGNHSQLRPTRRLTSVKTEQVGRSAPRTARIRSPLLCLVIGSSERTARSPAMPGAFFASNGCSSMKRAFPRSRRVKKTVSKTADRSECPRVRSRSIKNRLPAVVPQCRARSQGLERISQLDGHVRMILGPEIGR